MQYQIEDQPIQCQIIKVILILHQLIEEYQIEDQPMQHQIEDQPILRQSMEDELIEDQLMQHQTIQLRQIKVKLMQHQIINKLFWSIFNVPFNTDYIHQLNLIS